MEVSASKGDNLVLGNLATYSLATSVWMFEFGMFNSLTDAGALKCPLLVKRKCFCT